MQHETTSSPTKENAAPPAICVDDVAADYGHGRVLEDICFNIPVGHTFGLMGLNGAGKTTLIKIILGLMESAAGNVSLFGQPHIDKQTKNNLAYLPEKFEPPVFLSGMEFIRFSLKLYGRDCADQDIFAAADRVALDRQALTRRVNTYSKGMRQKTGLIGTWMTGCPLLILDEPMSGLDPRARVLVKEEILACKKRGMTIFLSSHILADMDEICDTVGVIHDGHLLFTGTPSDLKQKTGQAHLERAFLSIIDNKQKARA